eukprot:4278833-Pyramimonas_sp.AAC.1
MTVPSKDHVFSRVQATQGCHPGGIYNSCPEQGPRVFTCPGHSGVYRTWWSRAGTMCFYLSRPPE